MKAIRSATAFTTLCYGCVSYSEALHPTGSRPEFYAQIKYAWITEHRHLFSVSSMCYFLHVSRSSYYQWLNPSRTDKEKEDEELTEAIKQIFVESRQLYGSRRIRFRLAQLGKFIGRKRIIRLMRAAHLYCKTKRKFKVTTNSKHNNPISPNLLQRQFNVSKPDQYWVGDITYIPTSEPLRAYARSIY